MTCITTPFIAPTGPLSFVNIVEGKQSGLSSISSIKCSFCGHLNEVQSSAEHRAGSRGPLVSMGNTHPNNLLSTMNVPTMNHNLFKRREREVGNALENVSTDSCKCNLNLEKKIVEKSSGLPADRLPGEAVSYDKGWDTTLQLVMGLLWVLLLEKL